MFNPEQENALKSVNEWLKDPNAKQIYKLFGYAGTGKTTLAKHFAEGVDGKVLFGSFTGKAAHVLQQKGCPARTIHSLIYTSREKGRAAIKEMENDLAGLMKALADEGYSQDQIMQERRVKDINRLLAQEKKDASQPHFVLNPDSDVQGAELVIIDECSMVDAQMGEDLLSFGTKVLVLGDPAQLPPVKGEGFFTQGEPDFMLTEIHRQAKDNPILLLATTVREGGSLDLGNYGESSVISLDMLDREQALSAEQIIVGRNKTRTAYNARLRSLRGFDTVLPGAGERLICLRNDHEQGLLNGALWTCFGSERIDDDTCYLDLRSETAQMSVQAHTHHFENRELPFWTRNDAQEFTFGYAITCHKSQGSQWDSVMVIDESRVFRNNARKWLYTAITRAAQKLTIAV